MKRHVETVHKNDQQFFDRDLTEEDLKFPCVKCDKKFVSGAILRNHLAFHKQVEFAEIKPEDPATNETLDNFWNILNSL